MRVKKNQRSQRVTTPSLVGSGWETEVVMGVISMPGGQVSQTGSVVPDTTVDDGGLVLDVAVGHVPGVRTVVKEQSANTSSTDEVRKVTVGKGHPKWKAVLVSSEHSQNSSRLGVGKKDRTERNTVEGSEDVWEAGGDCRRTVGSQSC
jgi:hypothetical protein